MAKFFKYAAPFLAIIVFVVLLFVFLESKIDRIEHSEHVVGDFKLIAINPPKRMRVDLQDVSTGRIYKNQHVSKWCSNYKQHAIIGKVYTLKRGIFTHESGQKTTRLLELRDTFCQ